MKIVVNKCFGGFGLSEAAFKELGIPWNGYGNPELSRDDPKLVACVEKLGNKAWGKYAELSVVNIPDDVEWTIEEYDGTEWVAEVHRTWS